MNTWTTKEERLALYPADWKAISRRIRVERAQLRCECTGECGLHHERRCIERHLDPAFFAKGRIILTTAHLDHDPMNCADENLKAMCQRCHLRYDRGLHNETKDRRRDAVAGQQRIC